MNDKGFWIIASIILMLLLYGLGVTIYSTVALNEGKKVGYAQCMKYHTDQYIKIFNEINFSEINVSINLSSTT